MTGLTDRDEQVAAMLGRPETGEDDIDDGDESAPAPEEMARDDLEQEVQALRSLVHEMREDFQQFKQDTAQKINQIEKELDGEGATVGSTTLEKYASMPEQVRADTLSKTEQRAVKIYLAWEELCFGRDDEGRRYIDTQTKANTKHNPSRIKVELRDVLDEDLQSTELYRAMRMVAKLSGSEEATDSYNRLHVTGGDFEYHELPVADNSKLRKVLREVSE